ncbi:transcriptional regulator, HxlR family [Streptoalloteichus tenebrarius]|uniref:Transcriptional regulator, HxlR family n=1 Tax=Streptoalloteichus tenebrarius (strain ATCC 17920 / DSM 40477 / JCM 4838 / CBS 697.72 / NBRC 16177 / NCIMB 11028 / NRRL B-12390 / A12253. 1 / ISP 5477) TaxID=1933 RepID=A0ABT1I1G3_STRSD|nr:helix-turn-helix domain-containing protein [Streptoalloteichus tenebrarius]MCP2261617.1 transcriptional regulator, HxlR family [Streptoalloteichus tenebrarius]
MSDQAGALDERADVMRANTVARQVINRIADKSALLIISALGGGTLRFSDLHGRIEGVSHKMLTQTLRGLERDGLVVRRVHPTSPPSVDDTLTPPGHRLLETVTAICAWTRDHIDHIESSRAAFDARSTTRR